MSAASHLNRATLVGRVASTLEELSLPQGRVGVRFKLVTTATWVTKDGVAGSRNNWHRIVIMNDRIAELVMREVEEGMLVLVEGAIESSSHVDKAGKNHTKTEIILGPVNSRLLVLNRELTPAGDVA